MMVAPAHARWMIASAALHAAVFALLVALPAARTAVSRGAPVTAVEVTFDAPPQAPTTVVARPITAVARPTTAVVRPSTAVARPSTAVARPTTPCLLYTSPSPRD